MQGVFLGITVNPIGDAPLKTWHSWLTGGLMVLPWVHPWAPSPLPNVVPLLISWGCIGLLMVWGLRLKTKDIARAWVIAALISSAMGLVQYFGLSDAWSGWLHVPEYLGEARANLRQRNQLATLTALGILATLWWASNGLRRSHALWMLALLAAGNAATNSRTGLLQMLLACALVWWWGRLSHHGQRLSWRLALWSLVVYALSIWVLPLLLSAIAGTQAVSALSRMGMNDGCGSRAVLWRNVLELIAQTPWWGWGWGELKFAHYSAQYSGERFCEILGNAHNGPLQLAFTLGVPLASLIILSLTVFVLRMRPWQTPQTNQQLAWGVLSVIGLHSMLEYPLWYGPFQMAVLLCVVLLFQAKLETSTLPQRGLLVLGASLMSLVAALAVDYSRVRQVFIPPGQRSAVWPGDALSLAKSSLVFQSTAQFAQYSLTPVTADNAHAMLEKGLLLLHYSPEPKVIRKVIEAAQMVGDEETAALHQKRLKVAFGMDAGQIHKAN
jgi:O-antigen ligase